MTTLLCLGLGYSARRYVADFGASYSHIFGTSRPTQRPGELAATRETPTITRLMFDGTSASSDLVSALRRADRVLVSIPPSPQGDPVLAALSEEFGGLPRPQTIVYLSSVGVYGDHAGAEVDETTPPAPKGQRALARHAAERAWRALAGETGKPLAVLRLAGIYGPGRNVLVKLAQGRAVRIVKPDQVFNRIHVADVAQAIEAAFARRANGVFNVADDEPCAAADMIVYGAQLMGMEPPPAMSFSDAAASMSPMARSFYAENKRVRNEKLKQELGVRLLYPNYRCGLSISEAKTVVTGASLGLAD
jgi:dTDP-4-dehydrorhamnose reductase